MLIECLPVAMHGTRGRGMHAGYRLCCNTKLQKRVRACVAHREGRPWQDPDGTAKDRLFTGCRGRVGAVHQPEAARKPSMRMRASPSVDAWWTLRGTQASEISVQDHPWFRTRETESMFSSDAQVPYHKNTTLGALKRSYQTARLHRRLGFQVLRVHDFRVSGFANSGFEGLRSRV